MDIKILRTEIIKPSSPTPHHLRSFRLSLLDQFSPIMFTRVLLFFSPTGTCARDQKPATMADERSELLKTSLSQTLTSFYLFAGRFKDNLEIDCNDEGVEFVEMRVGCSVSAIIEKPDPESLLQLVPSDKVLSREVIATVPLLRLKVNFFECGGLVIGLSLTHKIADAATISTFLNYWAANMQDSPFDSSVLLPQFVPPSLFPQSNLLSSLPAVPMQPSLPQKITGRRLIFRGPRIAALRSQLASSSVQNPTRVEAVLSLIWKCAMEASRASKSGSSQLSRSGLLQAVNVRKRLDPPLPENSIGNLSWVYTVKCSTDPELRSVVGLIRKGIEEFSDTCNVQMRSEGMNQCFKEFGVMSKDEEMDIYVATSWCRFPFYGVDFGWGKPSWVCVPNVRAKNFIVLMDARDEYEGGIEVCLCLSEEEMACFERSQDLLEFASFSP